VFFGSLKLSYNHKMYSLRRGIQRFTV
jgi:hypothetical protein